MKNYNNLDYKESFYNMLASEKSLKKDWDNELDEMWNYILYLKTYVS